MTKVCADLIGTDPISECHHDLTEGFPVGAHYVSIRPIERAIREAS